MSLQLFTGVAGTGKTLYALQKYVIPELAKGTQVYTNIDGLILSRVSIIFKIDMIQLERCYHQLINPSRFWEEIPKNALVVLDEAQNIFNNRDWQNPNNNDCVHYLMEHRHYGHHLIFLTPHIETVDSGIRRVCEFTYKHKSFSAMGNSTTVKCAIFNQANTQDEPLQMFTWQHDRRVYDCYKSYFEDGTTEVKPCVNPLRNAKLVFFAVLVLLSFFIAVSTLPKLIGRYHKKVVHVVPLESTTSVRSSVIMINDSVVDGNKYRRIVK
jgi:zona occludens toxin (predicted ATPase)